MTTNHKPTLSDDVPRCAVASGRAGTAILLCVAALVITGTGSQRHAAAARLVEDSDRGTLSLSVPAAPTNAGYTLPIARHAAGLDTSAPVMPGLVQLANPPLPAPSGAVIKVSTEPQLQAAVRNLRSDTTNVIAPGTYVLTSTLSFGGSLKNVSSPFEN